MLYLIAGHSLSDPGGVNEKKITESSKTRELRGLINHYLNKQAQVDDDNQNLSQVIATIKSKATKNDLIVDIHWNASANDQANGSEVLIGSDAGKTSKEVAAKALKILTDLGFRDRGVKAESESARGKLGIFRTVAPTILIEVCFLSNEADMERYEKNKDTLAKQLADLFKPFI